MADIEFYYDAVCPFAWITSRWIHEVKAVRGFEVTWKPISLQYLNENQTAEWYTAEYRAGHHAGRKLHRVAAAVSAEHGNDGVERFYTAAGTMLHPGGRGAEARADMVAFAREALGNAGLSASFADRADDDSADAAIVASSEEALGRTGRDVGTPIVVFHSGLPDEGAFFGPVMQSIPRGDQALRLFDAVEVVATTPGLAELKRSVKFNLRFD